ILLRRLTGAAALAAAALWCCLAPASAEDAAKVKAKLQTALLAPANQVETVRFANPHWRTVQVVRGTPNAGPPSQAALPVPQFRKTATNTELVSFGDGTGRTVAVVRGSGLDSSEGAHPPVAPPFDTRLRFETVHFSDPLMPAVAVVRGAVSPDLGFSLFGAANGGELDRVAFAIDGVESGHGSNLAMWRDHLGGPQGPMQVSAAAALDVGGGNRFDLRENRMIGRAYVALLYRRYGNWPDAIAAYNWGPGNFDNWIAAGRPMERLPLETTHYLARVLRDAFL
ncbi:MAG TPA: lytic transglycosylase domain-containing protein, partial [Stellaceae bacterium]|nr:lytic transglycosylase domain-containing protein [Stellaceae bacterium]